MRGKALDLDKPGYYVTPQYQHRELNLIPKSVYQKSEIFGPNVAIFTPPIHSMKR